MNVILALYPNARGLNYVCIQMPTTLLDYGIINLLPFSTVRFMKRVEKFIEFFRPTIVVLRDLNGDTFRGKQAHRLIDSITKLAKERNLPIHSYSRQQIRDVFEIHNAWTKHEISQKIATWIPDLAPFAPRPRKLYLPEDHRMGIFDATALAITHDYLAK